jgi:hypothetical protein
MNTTVSLPGPLVALILLAIVIVLWALFCTKVLMPLYQKYGESRIWRLLGGEGDPPEQSDD